MTPFVVLIWHEPVLLSSGGSRGGARGARSPLIIRPNWCPRGPKILLIYGSGWPLPPPPPPHPPSQGLDPALFSMCLQHDWTKSGIIWVDFRLVSKTVTFEKCEADLPMKLFIHPTYQNLLIWIYAIFLFPLKRTNDEPEKIITYWLRVWRRGDPR